MGNEQSSKERSKSMRAGSDYRSSRQPSLASEADVAYVASTASKPIGDSPKRSALQKAQSLGASVRLSTSPKPSPMKTTTGHHIVTVHEASASEDVLENDPAIVAMKNVPHFDPILRDTIRNPIMKELMGTNRLDMQAACLLVSKYQNLLKVNAEKIAKDELNLTHRMSDMDYAINTLHQVLNERNKKLTKQTEQFNTVSQIQALLNSTRMCLLRTTETLEKINDTLPVPHRLEPLDLKLQLDK